MPKKGRPPLASLGVPPEAGAADYKVSALAARVVKTLPTRREFHWQETGFGHFSFISPVLICYLSFYPLGLFITKLACTGSDRPLTI